MIVASFLLCIALSIDVFAASIAYGSGNLSIPLRSALLISGICAALFSLSVLLGGVLAPLISPTLAKALSTAWLLVMGVLKLFDSVLKTWISRAKGKRQIGFRLFEVRFLLQIYADPKQADRDCSRVLTFGEALSFAIAMSLDGVAIGFGAGFSLVHPLPALLICLPVTLLAVLGGARFGRQLARLIRSDCAWLSGLLLIGLALSRL